MKRLINTSFTLIREHKKSLCSISLLFLFIISSYSQSALSNKGKLKTIVYENNDYGAIGYVDKKKFQEGQELTFVAKVRMYGLDLNMQDTIVSGRYYCADDGASYIDGIKKINRGFGNSIIMKGKFLITNNKNEIGVTANKKEGDKLIILIEDLAFYKTINDNYYGYNDTISLQKLTDNKYFLKINYKNLTLETTIPFVVDKNSNSYDFDNYVKKSEQVKLSFRNGDLFTGTVKEPGSYDHYSANFIPDSGEYKYATGEVFNGKIYYSNVFYRFLPYKGSIVFTDGTIDDENWLKNYVYILSYTEQEDLFRECKSLTELRDKTKIIYDKKKKKIEQEEKEKEKARLEKLQKHLNRQEELVTKYGDYYGNKILEGELALGMSQEMVNEYWPKKHFNISYINRNNNKIEIWAFDKKKMQGEIIKEGKDNGQEDGALGTILMLNLSEQLGGLDVPKMLVFTNNKLTEIYR
jgi:hypothetical protein